MCKICELCNGIMNYDPYFKAEVCGRCGRIERESKVENQKKISHQSREVSAIKQGMEVALAHL